MVTVVPRGDGPAGSGADDVPREPEQWPGSARTAPTLLGVVRAVANAILHHPEAALVTSIAIAMLGDIVGWW
jgi:hypothetical protein